MAQAMAQPLTVDNGQMSHGPLLKSPAGGSSDDVGDQAPGALAVLVPLLAKVLGQGGLLVDHAPGCTTSHGQHGQQHADGTPLLRL